MEEIKSVKAIAEDREKAKLEEGTRQKNKKNFFGDFLAKGNDQLRRKY